MLLHVVAYYTDPRSNPYGYETAKSHELNITVMELITFGSTMFGHNLSMLLNKFPPPPPEFKLSGGGNLLRTLFRWILGPPKIPQNDPF